MTCQVEDCSRKHYAHGHCSLHYARMRKTGATDPPPPTGDRWNDRLPFLENEVWCIKCQKCGMAKPIDQFPIARNTRSGRRATCLACNNAEEKARPKAHRVSAQPGYKRAERFRRIYGITIDEYDQMLADQDGRCAICREPSSWNRREGDVLPIDHDHATGKVRGLLCHPCNQALGLMRDNPGRLRAAADYIEVKQDEAAKE